MTFLTYENKKKGIKINYPPDWEVVEDEWRIELAFTAPFESSVQYRGSVVVDVQDISEHPMTLDEYTDLSLKEIEQVIGNLKINKIAQTILVGNKAHKLIFSRKQGEYDLKMMQIWTIIGNEVYTISYSHGFEYFPKYLKIVQEMANSFKII